MALLPSAPEWGSCLSFHVYKHVLPVCVNTWSCAAAVFECSCVPAYGFGVQGLAVQNAQNNIDRQQHKQHTARRASHQRKILKTWNILKKY